MKKILLAISFALFTTFNAHAVLEDFVCPDGFVCPEDIMVEVEYWAIRYGDLDDTQMMVYDGRYRNIYSIYQCDGICTQDSKKIVDRDRVKDLVTSVQTKVEQKNFDFTAEELPIYESIKSVKNFKWNDIKDRRTGQTAPASSFVVYEYGRKKKFLENSKFYNENRDFIADQLEKNNLPAALEFLPFAESEYDPFVVSSAACVGTWQLSKAAATGNGLIVNTSIDERRDPIKSTVAAMGYYTNAKDCIEGTACQIDSNFHSGDVGPLLMLSYIYGVSGTLNAMNTLQTTNFMHIRNNYTGSAFGKDTKGYLSKFLGVYHVGTNQEKYFGKLNRIVKPDTQVLLLSKATKTKPITVSLELNVNELKYFPANMRYTDSVWSGVRPIPPNNEFEIPYVVAPEVQKYGKVIAVKRPAPRVKIETMNPRPIQLIPVNSPAPKLAKPAQIQLPELDKKKKRRAGF
ncbi:MAG: transglycosylase SLT domain-containing protein [Proteobacteria bacterium]|jgi:hypothetical protein|nr:transglycosylase SLT domain-containing protein [Pseudomonadota bacterium]